MRWVKIIWSPFYNLIQHQPQNWFLWAFSLNFYRKRDKICHQFEGSRQKSELTERVTGCRWRKGRPNVMRPWTPKFGCPVTKIMESIVLWSGKVRVTILLLAESVSLLASRRNPAYNDPPVYPKKFSRWVWWRWHISRMLTECVFMMQLRKIRMMIIVRMEARGYLPAGNTKF